MTTQRVAVVPHTHWDREWYEPFQSFRLRLVEMVDGLLELLENDLSYARFMLDGQMAVVDDYLEIRPHQEGRIRDLAVSGRLSVGPWYILMDEFLVSGETIIRNLQTGMNRAACFGGAMPVGYLPDMFGHIAQMPQILRQAGFSHAVVWRGVPSSIERDAFWWSSPDGSTVRAEYLACGYGNGASLPDHPEGLLRRLKAQIAEMSSYMLDGLLLMNGTDHQSPQPWLGRVIAETNSLQDEFDLAVTSLAEELALRPTEGLPSWTGELRSGARANLLMGVVSNRMDVKRAAALAERELERRAEPACALFLPAERWPEASMEMAWRALVLNSAHDSVCACSADEVVDAVLERYAEARQIASGLANRAIEALAGEMANPGPVIVNTSARSRCGTIEITLPLAEPPEGTQQVGQPFSLPGDMTLDAATARLVLGAIQGEEIQHEAFVTGVDIEDFDEGLSVLVHIGPRARAGFSIDEAKRELYARLGAQPHASVRVRIDQPPSVRVLARSRDVPGYGWSTWEPGPLDFPVTVKGGDGSKDGPPRMSNGLITVGTDPIDGTFSIGDIHGMGRLVDGGDLGDTYNYSPPRNNITVDTPKEVRVHLCEAGPVRAAIEIVSTYLWPEFIDTTKSSRTGEREVAVRTRLELHAGERFLRVATTFDNHCRDHRLRVLLPLPSPAQLSEAECAFAIVNRGLTAEGGPHERGLPTWPSRRFVRAGGLTVAHEGLLEYELVDQAKARCGNEDGEIASADAIALTVLRATGMLSRPFMSYRPLPAGPTTSLVGPQMQGPIVARYALCCEAIDPYAMVDDAFLPLESIYSLGGGKRARFGTELEVSGAEVSCIRRSGSAIEVRVFNPKAQDATVHIPNASGWLVDLTGRPLDPFRGAFTLGPWAIATARISR